MNFIYYIFRLNELGLIGIGQRLNARLKRKFFALRYKNKSLLNNQIRACHPEIVSGARSNDKTNSCHHEVASGSKLNDAPLCHTEIVSKARSNDTPICHPEFISGSRSNDTPICHPEFISGSRSNDAILKQVQDDKTATQDDKTATQDDKVALHDDKTATQDNKLTTHANYALQDDKTATQDDNTALPNDKMAVYSNNAMPRDDKIFVSDFSNLNFDKIIQHHLFQKYLNPKFKNSENVKELADAASNNCFEILEKQICLFQNFSWHQDFKAVDKKVAWQNDFYQDISLTNNTANKIKPGDYLPDAKTPWELSRFQQIFALGMAYKNAIKINDIESATKYSQTFFRLVNSWLNQNPFSIGINWLCPMEVGIRAINLIWGIYFFKDEKDIENHFWTRLQNSLHQHAIYLEYNWETSDKPNNHYISDLIGYFYLCTLFKQNKKIEKKLHQCKHWLLDQFNHQINLDGSSYEGSTYYHRLVSEMFLHFKIMCDIQKIQLPKSFDDKFEKCLQFLDACTIKPDSLVQIGDNDSGKILVGMFCQQSQTFTNLTSQRFYDFGLTVIKCNKPNVHLTFRTPPPNAKQPSGHVHNDFLSITLSLDDEPVLVDPGSYLYTSNSWWRNTLRSATSHNAFYLKETHKSLAHNETAMFSDLFQNPVLKTIENTEYAENSDLSNIHTSCSITQKLNNNQKLSQTRSLNFDVNKNILEIFDSINSEFNEATSQTLMIEWTLNFAPGIDLEKGDKDGWWILLQNDKKIFLTSSLQFTKTQGSFSKAYGQIEKTNKLTAQAKYQRSLKVLTTLQLP